MDKQKAIEILTEYNKWRRSEGEYEWSDDPTKHKQLEITPAEIGQAIEFAVHFMKTATAKQ